MLTDADLDVRIEALIAALSHMGEPHIVAEDSGRRRSYEIEHVSATKWTERADVEAVAGAIDGARAVLRSTLAEVRRLKAVRTEDYRWAQQVSQRLHDICPDGDGDLLDRVVAEIERLRADLTAARRDAATCRAVATEALGLAETWAISLSRNDRLGRHLRSVNLARVDEIRAGLASPDPGPAVEAVERLVIAAGRTALARIDDDGLSTYRERVHDHAIADELRARADVLRLLGVSEVP